MNVLDVAYGEKDAKSKNFRAICCGRETDDCFFNNSCLKRDSLSK